MGNENQPTDENNNPQNGKKNLINSSIDKEKTTEGKCSNIKTDKNTNITYIEIKIKGERRILGFKIPDFIQSFIAICILGTFITSICVSRCQYSQTGKALEYTRKADSISEQALKLATRADSIGDTLAIKDTLARERNTKRELRAYVAIIVIRCDTFMVNHKIWYSIDYQNTGKTPAYEVTSYNRYIITETDISNKIFKFRSENEHNCYDMRGAGLYGNMVCSSRNWLTFADYKAIMKGDKIFYLYGIIYYKDIFGGRHRTWYCSYYVPSINRFASYKKEYNRGD